MAGWGSAVCGAADDAAGNFGSGVAGGLGFEIIGAAVDPDGSSKDIPDAEAVRLHRQIRPAVAQQQRGQIACVPRVRRSGGIVVAARVRKALPRTAPAFVNMESEETGFGILRQPRYGDCHQNASVFLIKFDSSGQARRLRSALDPGYGVRLDGTDPHIITSYPAYAQMK